MGMGTGEIYSAIKEINEKKENLRKSLKQLQSSNCWNLNNLKWEDLNSYFKTLESSLQTKFNLLLLHNQSSSSQQQAAARNLIQKLIDKDMHITAVNFSIQLHTAHHFPPVRLLEERKLMSIGAIDEARHHLNNHQAYNDIMLREINTLKAIIKCVDDNHLQSEYPKDSVVELVNKLENELENAKQDLVKSKKRPHVSNRKLLSKPKQNKFLKTATSAEPPTTTQNVIVVEEPHSQASDHIDPYHSSSCGSDPTAPYVIPCELARANSGHSGNLISVDNETGFFVSQSHPLSTYNSNGWISE